MKTSTPLLLATLLTSTLALPTTTHLDLSTASLPTWSVTNWTEGCSPGGCTYSFNISTHAPPPATAYNPSSPYPEPAFSTFCSGTDVQNRFVACDNPNVLANEVPGVSNLTLMIQHVWQAPLAGDEGEVGTFWILGNHTIVFPIVKPAAFEVPQMEMYAIA